MINRARKYRGNAHCNKARSKAHTHDNSATNTHTNIDNTPPTPHAHTIKIIRLNT